MGTPPEDDSGAEKEGAPKSERTSSLAARIDAFMEDSDEEAVDVEEVVEPSKPVAVTVTIPAPPIGVRPVIPPPVPKPPPIPPRVGQVAIPPASGRVATPRPVAIPPVKPPAIPIPRASQPIAVPSVVTIPGAGPPVPRPPTEPPPLVARTKTGEPPPVPRATPTTPPTHDEILSGVPDITTLDGGVEVSTATPSVGVDQPLEAQLEHPSVVEKAVATLGDAGGEARAEEMAKDLEAKVLTDPTTAALVAYELGELYERRLADEARAVKAFGRAVNLDPSLRANLWAIRRVFYRRELWPNLTKLIDAEVAYARDDFERADLLLEKARVHAHRANETNEARTALDEAVRIAPQHQGVLLELERVVAKSGDAAALVDVWERLAEAVEQPARKIGYWLEVGRAAETARDLGRAQEAFDKASQLAGTGPEAERIARERLRVAEEHGTPAEVIAAIEALATVMLAAFGPGGPASGEVAQPPPGERLDRASALRHELVALRRRQSQLVRAESPEKSWELLQQASALLPGEPIILSDLTELAEELGRYDDLAELVQSWQALESDPSRAMALSIRRADALLRGGQRDVARALLASLEAAAPGFIVLTSAAERDALAGKDLAALAKAYLASAQAMLLGSWLGPGQESRPEPDAAAALYVQAAELLAYEVGTPEAIEEAHGALVKAIEAVADYPAAIEALTELDDSTGNVAAALERLRTAAAKAEGEPRRALLERAIRVVRSHGDLEAVLELQRELAAFAPREVALRWQLEATLAQLGRDDERAELLEQLAKDESDATGRGTALLAAARLRERGGAVEAATELYRQVLALWPDDTFARV